MEDTINELENIINSLNESDFKTTSISDKYLLAIAINKSLDSQRILSTLNSIKYSLDKIADNTDTIERYFQQS